MAELTAPFNERELNNIFALSLSLLSLFFIPPMDTSLYVRFTKPLWYPWLGANSFPYTKMGTASGASTLVPWLNQNLGLVVPILILIKLWLAEAN